MYNTKKMPKTKLKGVLIVEGEALETQIERMLENKEKINETSPLLYFERKEGVVSATDIRHDKWEDMAEAGNGVKKEYNERYKKREDAKLKVIKGGEEDNGVEPIQGKG